MLALFVEVAAAELVSRRVIAVAAIIKVLSCVLFLLSENSTRRKFRHAMRVKQLKSSKTAKEVIKKLGMEYNKHAQLCYMYIHLFCSMQLANC